MLKVISEYGIIKELNPSLSANYDEKFDSLNDIFVSEKAFQNLKNLAFEPPAEGIFCYSIRRGKEQIQVKNYVGLLETKDGTQIEILPKVCNSDNVSEHRKGFLKMLKCLKKSPFKQLKNAHLQNSNLPILEIFTSLFLDEIEKLFSQGLGQQYVEISSNESYLKGKLLFRENLQQNVVHQELFFIKFDDFLADIPQNRLLKSCLQFLHNQSVSSKNHAKIQQFLFILEEVNFSKNYNQDFIKTDKSNRLFDRYKMALNYAKIFLQNESFSPFGGKNLNFALLFPMEQLFENYVATGFRKYLSEDYKVSLQDSSNHLIINHLDAPKFKLRPDILVEKNGKNFIFDTKWKVIDATKKNYDIEQADLYQLYAYGKKYNSSNLCLIYPKNENFQEPLQVFNFEENLQLNVVPFDILGDLEGEIFKIFLSTFSPQLSPQNP